MKLPVAVVEYQRTYNAMALTSFFVNEVWLSAVVTKENSCTRTKLV